MGSAESAFGYRPRDPKPCFIVENITHLKGEPKVIKIFNYPIPPFIPEKNVSAGTRDLMEIPGVSVNSIEHALIQGVLRHKILSEDIRVVCSNIELIQFDDDFKQFLIDAGIEEGLDAGSDGYDTAILPYTWRMDVPLIGTKDSVNRTFYTPEQFVSGVLDGHQLTINIYHNGRRLNDDSYEFTIGKSSGSNTDYDVINFVSFVPNDRSVLVANYVVRNTT